MMRKLLVIAILAIGVMAILAYRFYNKPHRVVADEEAVRIDAVELFDAFQQDEHKANLLYLDKALEIKGSVSEILQNQDGKTVVVLKTNDPLFGISCTMSTPVTVQPGMMVTIKGICTGYLSDVVITNGLMME